jgi:hypothetical protein
MIMKQQNEPKITGKPSPAHRDAKIEFLDLSIPTVRISSKSDVENFNLENMSPDRWQICSFEEPSEFLDQSGKDYWEILNVKHSHRVVFRLILSHYSSENFDEITIRISNNTCIDEISIDRMRSISPAQINKLGKAVKHAGIKQLFLTGETDDVSDKHMQHFFNGLAGSTAITALDFTETYFDTDSKIKQLAALLSSLPNIKTLILYNCNITKEGYQLLAESIRSRNELAVLDLQGNNGLTVTDLFELTNVMQSLQYLGTSQKLGSSYRMQFSNQERKVKFYSDPLDDYTAMSILYPLHNTPRQSDPKNESEDLGNQSNFPLCSIL